MKKDNTRTFPKSNAQMNEPHRKTKLKNKTSTQARQVSVEIAEFPYRRFSFTGQQIAWNSVDLARNSVPRHLFFESLNVDSTDSNRIGTDCKSSWKGTPTPPQR